MENNFEIIITQRAYSDICECVAFVKNVSVESSEELYKEIISSINSLKVYPNKYSEVNGLKIKDSIIRKMPIHNGRYCIFYKVEKETIVIYDILDSRQDKKILVQI